MALSPNRDKILVLVEGKKTEVSFLSRYFTLALGDEWNKEIDVIPFEINIYAFWSAVSSLDSSDFSTIDVLKGLFKRDSEKLEVLKGKFPYIFLIFDFDIHNKDSQKTIFDKEQYNQNISILRNMTSTFNNETDKGLLLIDYPMCESYRDIDFKDPKVFEFRMFNLEESEPYKNIVAERGNTLDISEYKKKRFDLIISSNIKKLNKLYKNDYSIPDYASFVYMVTNSSETLNKQISTYEETKYFLVLNCMVFIPVIIYGEPEYKLME